MARAQDWDLILGSRLVLLLEQLLLAPRVSQVMPLWVTIPPGKCWLHWCGSGQVGFTSFLCYEEVLFCIAVHDSFFLICTCLKFIERGIFSKAQVVVLWWIAGYASESLISLT